MTTFSHNWGRLGTGCLPSLTSANSFGLQSLSDRMAKVCKQYIINADRHSHCSLSLCSRGIDLTSCQLKYKYTIYLFMYLFIHSFIITVSDYIHLNPFVLHSNNDGFRHGGPGHGGEQVGHSGWEGPQIEKEVSVYPKCHFTRTFWGGVSIVIVP